MENLDERAVGLPAKMYTETTKRRLSPLVLFSSLIICLGQSGISGLGWILIPGWR